MTQGLTKGLIYGLGLILLVLTVGLLASYEVINIEFISWMENQPSIRPMEMPFPVPEGSVPIQGAAYVGGIGAPENPVEADEISIERGLILYDINCRLCHGSLGTGDGPVAAFLANVPPRNLIDPTVAAFSDGDIFLVITNGTQFMPPLDMNLDVRSRWDVVNYVRVLQANAGQ
jgi:mono/diheme cytochrome c family protein